MSNHVIRVQDFRKVYGDFVAVQDVSFAVMKGEIFGLLGPNGAGKTSTLECLEGIRRADGGQLEILGLDPGRDARQLRHLIGVQLQTSALPDNMTVAEAMKFFSAYHNIKPRDDLLERMGLTDKRKTQYHQLSTGLKRRLALALAIAHRPQVLFLDEPTAGLDVESRSELHHLMRELRAEGAAIILATHDMAEAENLSDRVAILLQGKIVAMGAPVELTAAASGYTKVSVRTEKSLLLHNSVTFPAVEQRFSHDGYSVYYSIDPGPTVTAILDTIAAQKDRLIDLRVERPSLEERFLEITANGGNHERL